MNRAESARGPRPGRRAMSSMTSAELALELGRRVRSARAARGWSQPQLATAIGGNGPEISRYERGKRIPSVETLRQLCIALEVSANQLLQLPEVGRG